MLLVTNSCLLQEIFASIRLGANIFTLINDLKQILYQDSLCIFRAYIADGICAILIFSFLLQAVHRYIIVVYPNRLFCQSIRFQIVLICLTWLFGLLYPLEFLLRDEIIYNSDSQICQLPILSSFSIIYMAFCIYLIPILCTILIYLKLVRYVKKMRTHITPSNVLLRAQKELKMVGRISILMIILILLGLPYTIFIVMTFITELPKYHFRIALVFLDASLVFICIALFHFNEPLKKALMKRIKHRTNAVTTIV